MNICNVALEQFMKFFLFEGLLQFVSNDEKGHGEYTTTIVDVVFLACLIHYHFTSCLSI